MSPEIQARYAELLDGLKRAGLKRTPQRLAILELLAGNATHPTAQAVHRALAARFPSLSLTTVYNTLEALVALGMIHEMGAAADGATHYDANPVPHINLMCLQCGKVTDLPEDDLVPGMQAVAELSGYDIRGARIAYYGLCPACRKQGRAR